MKQLPLHPHWMHKKPFVTLLWIMSRLNDHSTKFVLEPFIRITPQLLVGPQLSRRGWLHLANKFSVNSIVNLRMEADDRERNIDPEYYLWLPTVNHTLPTIEQLQRAATFVSARIAAGDSVYIHCAAGMGRAPVTAAAYLVSQGYAVDDAMNLIRSRRPFVEHSSDQRTRLVQFEQIVNSQQVT